MAIDLCNASPRISFSHDLCPTDVASVGLPREDSLLAESDDFDFCVADSFEHDSFASCADELFSDGKILPQEIKKQQQILPPKPPARHNASKKDKENGLKTEEKLLSSSPSLSSSASTSASSSKSLFWRLTRSSSCGSGYTRSLICNLPLLSRSNSTGSAPNRNPKPSSSHSSHNHNKNSSSRSGGANGNTKLSSSSSTSSTSSAASSSYYPYSTSSKKNYGSKNNGIRVNPILNVPPPYISRGTVNLFGFGSLFCNGKDKEKNKKKRSTMVN